MLDCWVLEEGLDGFCQWLFVSIDLEMGIV